MKSIRTKLVVLVVTAVASTVIVTTLASAWRSAERQVAIKREELQAIAAVLSSAAATPLQANDRTGLARSLAAIGQITGITYVRVSDARGRTVHEYGVGIIVAHTPGVVEANPEISAWQAAFLSTYPVDAPIISSGQPIGRLLLIADLSGLRHALLESLLVSALIGLAAALAGLVLSHRLHRGIVQPILALTGAMDEVRATNDFSRAVARSSDDEVGNLVDSFNSMLREIRTRDVALDLHRQNLERTVGERTSDLANAKLAAEQANAAKSDFLATMSHEIRTPMNGMLVTAELLATSDLPTDLARHADVIVRSGQHLLTIINDILDLSKIEAGKIDLEAVPVSPVAVVDDALRLFAGRAAAKGLDLAGYVSTSVPELIASDPVRLTQVLANLVSNALKFTVEGSVAVSVDMVDDPGGSGRMLELCVTDQGPGIPADKLASIFDAFSQADQSTTRRYGGTGIGLTITRRIVDAMGGRIEVHSEIGEGSLFRVVLPVAEIEPAPALIPPSRTSRVVVALPEGATRVALSWALGDRGFTVDIVDTAADVPPNLEDACALFVAPGNLGRLDAFAAVRRGVAIVAIEPHSIAAAASSRAAATADLVIHRPLSTAELAACLAAIPQGRDAVARLSHRPSAPPAVADRRLTFPGARILAADDSAVNREVSAEAMRRLGAEVTTVEDGLAAVEAVTRGSYDLVFMDGSMPVMDGYAATRAIRTQEHDEGRPRVPIVALTAHVVGAHANQWRQAGLDDCVTKPFTLALLRDCLQRWIGHKAVTGDEPSVAAAPSHPQASSTPEPDPPSAPILDDKVLDQIRAMQRPGDDLVGRVVSLYRKHAPHALATLRERIASGEPKPVADAAHALKSLSRNIGAIRLGNLCSALESDAREGLDLTEASARYDAIAAVLDETMAALDRSAATAAA